MHHCGSNKHSSYADGQDFTGVTMTVTFGVGQTSASVDVPIIDDSDIEDSELFRGLLSTTDSGVTIGADTADVTILDRDGER